jgi:phosphomannomutase
LVELAKAKQQEKLLTDLIADLQEPLESKEFRLTIQRSDFKAYGNQVIAKLQEFANAQKDWTVIPHNYEGVRISSNSPTEDGWFLLRLSLHDPVIPLNIESNVNQGVVSIAARLLEFLQDFEALELSGLK